MFAYLAHFLLADDAVGPRQGLEEEDVGGAGEVLAEELGHAPEHAGKARLSPEKKKKKQCRSSIQGFLCEDFQATRVIIIYQGGYVGLFPAFHKEKVRCCPCQKFGRHLLVILATMLLRLALALADTEVLLAKARRPFVALL